MSDSLKAELKGLKKLISKFNDANLKRSLENLASEDGVVMIISQAITENFDSEGPGWEPLKIASIRQSIAKHLKKRAAEKESRKILQRTGFLRNSVTKAGNAHNIYRVDGTNLIWGTDLVYAAIHNSGGVINHPGTVNGFGRGIKIPPHNINIPKREFLKLSPKWKRSINDFLVTKILGLIRSRLSEGY